MKPRLALAVESSPESVAKPAGRSSRLESRMACTALAFGEPRSMDHPSSPRLSSRTFALHPIERARAEAPPAPCQPMVAVCPFASGWLGRYLTVISPDSLIWTW